MAATWVSLTGDGESPPDGEAAPALAPDGSDGSLAVAASGFRLQQIWRSSSLRNLNVIWFPGPGSLQQLNFSSEIFVLDIIEVPIYFT